MPGADKRRLQGCGSAQRILTAAGAGAVPLVTRALPRLNSQRGMLSLRQACLRRWRGWRDGGGRKKR